MEKVKVVMYGLGYVGCGLVELMMDKEWLKIVGAIDNAKDKVGKDVGEVAGVGKKLGVVVSDDADVVLSSSGADLVTHSTPFFPEQTDSQIMKAINAGANVITIADDRLAYPWHHWPQLSRKFDEAAKKKGVTVACGGFNPGFSCIYPAFVTGLSGSVKSIYLRMNGDVSPFGEGTMGKGRYGVGLTLEEWEKDYHRKFVVPARPKSDISHYMYRFTIVDLVADSMGWELDEVHYELKPVISKKDKVSLGGLAIPAGNVAGWNEMTRAIKDGETVMTIENYRVVFAKDEGLEEIAEVTIDGDMNIHAAIKGLVIARCSFTYMLNMIPLIMTAKPGIVTLRDIPPVTLC